MADNDVIGGLDNLIDTVSGDTPSYTVKDPNVDMVKAIDKCIDAAKGITGKTYEYKDPNTDVIQKMDELAGAISESGGGGSATLIEKSVTSNGTYKASDDEADGYSKVSVSVSPNVGTKSITENGTYTASSENLDGYSSVTVNVESSKQVSYLKWKITKLRGIPHSNAVQMAEFYLYQSGILYTWNANASVTADLAPYSPSEGPGNIIDGTNNKYVTTQWGSSQTGECNIVIYLGETITVDGNTSYAYETANDEISRDPIAWTLYGSSDGINWIVLDTVDNEIPTSRFATTPKYVIPMG